MTCENDIDRLQKEIHETAKANGWHAKDGLFFENIIETILTKILLIHTELSEAVEELRGANLSVYYDATRLAGELPKPSGWVVEIVDAVIRCLDLLALCNIDTGRIIREKMAYNALRPVRHGGKLF